MSHFPELILSSSSPARRALLARLPLPFTTYAPNLDETPLPDETGRDLVTRLARAKALASAEQFPNALIIGADQVGTLGDIILNKPLTHETAFQQLTLVSGKTVRFLTGLCLYNATSKHLEISVETYDVTFRTLTPQMIENYLRLENVLHCAGSFQADGLGITLIHQFSGEDYTTLIGLPLICLTGMLSKMGVDVLGVDHA